jgi:hypothetical protein
MIIFFKNTKDFELSSLNFLGQQTTDFEYAVPELVEGMGLSLRKARRVAERPKEN